MRKLLDPKRDGMQRKRNSTRKYILCKKKMKDLGYLANS